VEEGEEQVSRFASCGGRVKVKRGLTGGNFKTGGVRVFIICVFGLVGGFG
jgi:hypothetical protein